MESRKCSNKVEEAQWSNTCSTAGLVAFPVIPPYNAAKAGVANLTREAAIKYGTDLIRVNAVAPTAVKTNLLLRIVNDDPNQSIEDYETFNPLTGMPVPEDVAAAVAFLPVMTHVLSAGSSSRSMAAIRRGNKSWIGGARNLAGAAANT